MSDSKTCVRCQRGIDQWAKICPFCNWDQSEIPPPPESVHPPAQVVDYVPPDERGIKKKLWIGAAVALLLVASFLVGMVINRDGAPEVAPEPLDKQAAEHNVSAPTAANTPLIPTNEPGGLGQPITSAPLIVTGASTPPEYQRSDATAVASVEYAQLEKRALAERQKNAPLVDPRSLTGPAYAEGSRVPMSRTTPRSSSASRATNERERRLIARTRPVPEYQPLPPMRARGTARLTLTVGPDGRVSAINIDRPLRGNTPALLSSVKRWKFKPATENGKPVAAPYTVEISFKDNG